MTDKLKPSERLRRVFGGDERWAESALEGAMKLFEEICVEPGIHTMPDSPEMQEEDMSTVSAMWAYIRSSLNQAHIKESDVANHDFASAITVTMLATANVLVEQKLPPDNAKVKRFLGITGALPDEFIERNYVIGE